MNTLVLFFIFIFLDDVFSNLLFKCFEFIRESGIIEVSEEKTKTFLTFPEMSAFTFFKQLDEINTSLMSVHEVWSWCQEGLSSSKHKTKKTGSLLS